MAVITQPFADLPELEEPQPATATAPVAGTIAICLGLLSLAAAAIHFAFAPGHYSEAWQHGLFFLVIAWAQLLWGGAVLIRPSKRVVALGILNFGVIVAWIVSRTVGIGIGVPQAVEPVGLPDALSTAFEALIVVGSAIAIATPRVFAATRRPFAIAAVATVLAAVTGLSLTPRYADAHDHSGGSSVAAGGHTHAASGPALTGTTPCEKAGAAASPAQITDAEGHFHRGAVPQVAISQAERVALAAQQVQARSVVDKYPTVATAEAAGYVMSTPFVPCIGAHYTNPGLVIGFNPTAPSELLFDGTTPDAKLVGLSYLVYHRGGAPQGFAGANDHWHQHNANGGLCFGRSGVVIGGEGMTQAQCAAIGGSKRELADIWMLHDWVVPGWECSWGTFAAECPELGGRTGGSAFDAPSPNSVLPGSATAPAKSGSATKKP